MAEPTGDGVPTPAGRAVVVRPGGPADAPGLGSVHVRSWQAAYRGLIAQQYLDSLDVDARVAAWRRGLSEPLRGRRLLVATVDDRVAGFVMFGAARDPESGDDGELHALNVHPDHWRAGVGSALLLAAHDGLAGMGHGAAVLWVVPGNLRARSFYERHGWRSEEHERTIDVQGAEVPEVRYARRMP